MYLTTVINLIGVLSASGANAMYPSYAQSASYEFIESNQGPSYVDVDYNLYVSKIYIDVSGTLYFNSTSDFYLTDINFDIIVSHYLHESDGSYTYIDEFEITNGYGSKRIDLNNIDTNGTFDLYIEYSDVIDWRLHNPLATVQQDEYISGSSALPGDESLYETDYRYSLSFSGGFKTNVITYINNHLDNLDAFNQGYNEGFEAGYGNGVSDASPDAYQNGYVDGYNEGSSQDATAVVIFSGIVQVGLLPINFFLAMLNFEVFGINIGGLVSAFLTIAIVIIIIRVITGSGNGDNK